MRKFNIEPILLSNPWPVFNLCQLSQSFMDGFPLLDGGWMWALQERFIHSSSPERVVSHLGRENMTEVHWPGEKHQGSSPEVSGDGRQQAPRWASRCPFTVSALEQCSGTRRSQTATGWESRAQKSWFYHWLNLSQSPLSLWTLACSPVKWGLCPTDPRLFQLCHQAIQWNPVFKWCSSGEVS